MVRFAPSGFARGSRLMAPGELLSLGLLQVGAIRRNFILRRGMRTFARTP